MLHRQLRENPIYKNSKAVHCWIECLLRAHHSTKDYYLGRKKITLKQGEFIIGRKEFGQSVGISASTAWFWLERFEVDSMLDIKRTPKGCLCKVKNWKNYQEVDSKVVQKKCEKSVKKNTDNNDNNENNDNNLLREEKTAKYFYNLIKENTPTFREPNLNQWAKDIDLMIRRDNRTMDQIMFLMDWVQKDSFWNSNVMSPKKLRKHFDTLVAKIKNNNNDNKYKIVTV